MQRGLREVGFPIAVDGILGPRTHAAIHEFKRGWAFRTPPLRRSSSKPGRGFRLALRRSLRRNGACSRHFRYLEFASHGNHWIRLHYKLVRAAERLRRRVGPIAILSGYRDPAHNRAVGGAANSQHLYGCAFDPTRPCPGRGFPAAGSPESAWMQTASSISTSATYAAITNRAVRRSTRPSSRNDPKCQASKGRREAATRLGAERHVT